jgi:hypothetical protein
MGGLETLRGLSSLNGSFGYWKRGLLHQGRHPEVAVRGSGLDGFLSERHEGKTPETWIVDWRSTLGSEKPWKGEA